MTGGEGGAGGAEESAWESERVHLSPCQMPISRHVSACVPCAYVKDWEWSARVLSSAWTARGLLLRAPFGSSAALTSTHRHHAHLCYSVAGSQRVVQASRVDSVSHHDGLARADEAHHHDFVECCCGDAIASGVLAAH